MKISIAVLTILIIIGCQRTYLVATWQIDEYDIGKYKRIKLKDSLGFDYLIFKDGKGICAVYSESEFFQNNYQDTCHVLCDIRKDFYVNFDLCNGTNTIFFDDKIQLDYNAIDSITMRAYDSIVYYPAGHVAIKLPFDSNITNRLNESEMKTFIQYWNTATTIGYKKIGKSFEWLVIVYYKGSSRRFKVIDSDITENGSWSYNVKDIYKFLESINNRY